MAPLWSLVERVLVRCLPPRQRSPVLGDLREDYDRQRALHSQWRAAFWLVRECVSLIVAYRTSRGRRVSPAPRARLTVRGITADLRYALRSLRHAPWYAATVSAVMALGMAMTIAIFAIVDGVLFAPVPYAGLDRLFAVDPGWSKLPRAEWGWGPQPVSPVQLDAWRAALPGAAFTTFLPDGDAVTVGPSEQAMALRVASNFFDVVGVRPASGGFSAEDFATFPPPPVMPAIIAHRLWISRFGADPNVVGKTYVDEQGRGIRVAGILPPDFLFPDIAAGVRDADGQVQALTPFVLPTAFSKSTGRFLETLVRLPPSVTIQEAEARLTAASARLAAATPAAPETLAVTEDLRIRRGVPDVVRLSSVRDALMFNVRQMSQLVFWATLALTLLACLNVMSLAAARVQDRWRDLAIRRSLGAGSRDLARLLAIENAAIVAIGTATGLAVARPVVALIAEWLPGWMSLIKAPAIDARVIAFSTLVAACAATVITFGAVRAASSANVRDVLAAGGRTTRGRRRLIVGAQVAVALVLTVGGALLAGSTARVWSEDVGLREEDAAVIRLSTPPMTAVEIEQLMADLRSHPDVRLAGGIDRSLLERSTRGSVFDRPAGVVQGAESIAVTTGYFAAAGLRATAGRLLSDDEITGGAPLIVVSEHVASQYWRGDAALGQSLTAEGGRVFTVVGVVPDVRYVMLDEAPSGAIYWPMAANPKAQLDNVFVALAPGSGALRSVVEWTKAHCERCRITKAESVSDAMVWTIRRRLLPASILSSFGVAALVIVGVGLLGLVAMTTSRRTREIGVRMALGATPLRIVRQVVGEQALAVAMGLAGGGLIAAWAARFVQAYLYETSTYDLWAWSAAVVTLLVVAVVAALVPSLRAGRVDPVKALKAE